MPLLLSQLQKFQMEVRKLLDSSFVQRSKGKGKEVKAKGVKGEKNVKLLETIEEVKIMKLEELAAQSDVTITQLLVAMTKEVEASGLFTAATPLPTDAENLISVRDVFHSKSRAKRSIRSRNRWIDQNLVGLDGTDSYADLEDFIVDE